MFHQKAGTLGYRLQRSNLLVVESGLVPCCLILHQCFVDFHSRIQQCLFEAEAGFFLLCFRYFQLGNVSSFIK